MLFAALFPLTIESLPDLILMAGIALQIAHSMWAIPELRRSDVRTRRRLARIEKMLVEVRTNCSMIHGISFTIHDREPGEDDE